jgi:hypothetical protein
MKRIRNAAMLAAIFAFSGSSQAQVQPTPRTRVQLEDSMTSSLKPNAHKAVDPEEKADAHSRDYTQESRLNDRMRVVKRDKARAQKQQARASQ